MVTKEEVHKSLLTKRGVMTGNTVKEETKLENFDRIRKIQDEMIAMAKNSDWVLIEQKVEQVDPLDVIAAKLDSSQVQFMESPLVDMLESSDEEIPTNQELQEHTV